LLPDALKLEDLSVISEQLSVISYQEQGKPGEPGKQGKQGKQCRDVACYVYVWKLGEIREIGKPCDDSCRGGFDNYRFSCTQI